ncbi:MAG: methyltransferase, partial [Bacilli bacterium]|nr:methyltransferase [Bacilli bacterium]
SIYQNNPYIKNIQITKKCIKDLELKTDFYKPYELFALKDVCINKDYVEETSLAYFSDKFEFICIDKNNVTWMSIIPNEIETMKKPINNAKGNILILGLGLGYFAYMASQKEEVKQITIIENDADIIKLFNENLLPQFKNKHKIKIICDDAFSYLKKNNNYDYVFADLWHNAEDGISTYLTLKQMENKKCYYDYWLEDSFIALLRRAFISLLYEQSINFDESNYVNSKTILDKLINAYYKSTKNIELQNVNQLEDLLQKENLLKLIIG